MKYFFATKEVMNFGSVAKFSDKFDSYDANVWKLRTSFKAYSDIFPGGMVSTLKIN